MYMYKTYHGAERRNRTRSPSQQRAETLGKGFSDSVADMQGHAASGSHRAQGLPGIMGSRDKRRNDGVMRSGPRGVVM
jgi:hypothetical protein